VYGELMKKLKVNGNFEEKNQTRLTQGKKFWRLLTLCKAAASWSFVLEVFMFYRKN
jgi:hypothetical protein